MGWVRKNWKKAPQAIYELRLSCLPQIHHQASNNLSFGINGVPCLTCSAHLHHRSVLRQILLSHLYKYCDRSTTLSLLSHKTNVDRVLLNHLPQHHVLMIKTETHNDMGVSELSLIPKACSGKHDFPEMRKAAGPHYMVETCSKMLSKQFSWPFSRYKYTSQKLRVSFLHSL